MFSFVNLLSTYNFKFLSFSSGFPKVGETAPLLISWGGKKKVMDRKGVGGVFKFFGSHKFILGLLILLISAY